MSRVFLTLVILLVVSPCSGSESPRQFVRRFYSAYKTWSIRGVPDPKQVKVISPFLGTEVLEMFDQVNSQRDRWEKKHPFDPANPVKPPWCTEGDVFCDVWEGITHFSVGEARLKRGRMIVEAHLEECEGGETYTWTDRLVLDRAGGEWVVADVQYAKGGSLLFTIGTQLKEIEKYLHP
jgi:hypothetical protein